MALGDRISVRTWRTYEPDGENSYGDKCTKKVTVPGQAFTIKELKERIKKGRAKPQV